MADLRLFSVFSALAAQHGPRFGSPFLFIDRCSVPKNDPKKEKERKCLRDLAFRPPANARARSMARAGREYDAEKSKLKELTVEKLRTLCKKRDLMISGKKDDLVARILMDWAQERSADESTWKKTRTQQPQVTSISWERTSEGLQAMYPSGSEESGAEEIALHWAPPSAWGL